jgi:hypothetical protein
MFSESVKKVVIDTMFRKPWYISDKKIKDTVPRFYIKIPWLYVKLNNGCLCFSVGLKTIAKIGEKEIIRNAFKFELDDGEVIKIKRHNKSNKENDE